MKMASVEEFHKLVIQLGRKVIDIQNNVKTPFNREDIPLVVSIQCHEKHQRNSVLELIKDSDEYKELLDAFDESSEIMGNRQRHQDILSEFVLETINEIARGRIWDKKWVDRELSLMTHAVLDGLTASVTDTGIVIPILNIAMDEFRIDLGEFGCLRRATYVEKLDFAVRYPEDTYPFQKRRFKYVLDVGETDSTNLFPTPSKYFKILEGVILSLRLFYGGGVGLEYVHVWQELDETIVFTHPISRYLGQRGDPTNVISTNSSHLQSIIRSICDLDGSSFYIQSLRRHGAALYTLDFGFGDAIVDCVIGLECMFGSEREKAIQRILEITRNKHQQISWLFETGRYGELYGFEYETLLRKCWTARNKIAHGKSSAIAEKKAGMNLYWLSRIAMLFLRYGLLSASELGFLDRTDLLQKLDQRIIEEKSAK